MRVLFIIAILAIAMLVIVSYTQRNKTNGEQELETLTRLTITRLRWQPSRKIISVTSALDLKSQGAFFLFCGALKSEAHD